MSAAEKQEIMKINAKQAAEIRALAKKGTLTRAAIGKRYGISRQMVSFIIQGLAWRPGTDPKTGPAKPR